MAAVHRGRIIVGVDRSLISLRALRQAVGEASRRQADLTVVHVRRPAAQPTAQPALIGIPYPTPWPNEGTGPSLDREGEVLIATCINEALGGPPADVGLRMVVDVGTPRVCLVHQVRGDDDLLVVGTRGSRQWTHPWRRSVSRYCTTHAACPVLVVPPDSFARALRRERRWYRSLWRRDPWKQFDHQVGDDRQHVGRT